MSLIFSNHCIKVYFFKSDFLNSKPKVNLVLNKQIDMLQEKKNLGVEADT